jgi:hypothetical protein
LVSLTIASPPFADADIITRPVLPGGPNRADGRHRAGFVFRSDGLGLKKCVVVCLPSSVNNVACGVSTTSDSPLLFFGSDRPGGSGLIDNRSVRDHTHKNKGP